MFEQLRTAGVPVVILPVATNFAELYDKIATLGEIVDKQEAAATLSASIAADVESAIADVPRARTFALPTSTHEVPTWCFCSGTGWSRIR